MKSLRQAVELFHLLFLRQLGTKVPKNLCVLKGGSNLRFFFHSPRYSEDMDFDVQTIARGTLRKNVESILTSHAFVTTLRAQQLALVQWSAPKQTEMVQRWKLRLALTGNGLEAPTKLEFSRRRIEEGALLEPVDAELIQEHGISAVLANHYGKNAAFLQKIRALAHRTETQARDVFDLKLLLETGAVNPALSKSTKKDLAIAAERAMEVSFAEFQAQVVAFLPAEWQAYYGTDEVWEKLQHEVVDLLVGLAT